MEAEFEHLYKRIASRLLFIYFTNVTISKYIVSFLIKSS